jgi:hypothetical protein
MSEPHCRVKWVESVSQFLGQQAHNHTHSPHIYILIGNPRFETKPVRQNVLEIFESRNVGIFVTIRRPFHSGCSTLETQLLNSYYQLVILKFIKF